MKILNKYFILILLLLFILPQNITFAENSNLTAISFFIPKKVVKEGEQIKVYINAQSIKESMNAISGTFTFSNDLIKVISFSKKESIIDFWLEEPEHFNNKISFEGVILTPGFQGRGGTIFSVLFKAKKSGTVSLDFNKGSILANDGKGTNILDTLNNGTFKIIKNNVVLDESTVADNDKIISNTPGKPDKILNTQSKIVKPDVYASYYQYKLYFYLWNFVYLLLLVILFLSIFILIKYLIRK